MQQEIVAVCHNDQELEKIANEAGQRGEIIFIDEVNTTLSPTVARLLRSLSSGEPAALKKADYLICGNLNIFRAYM